ncbi:unnamed protein product [Cuscuta europaea]|uniref:Uncharacterized protein n=1 Tax=Cuscuta europaea TaxID=41803 RepID=A0A9P0ZDX8_CUSEU|nr:unnamed protein product [Cuscuta europaea]
MSSKLLSQVSESRWNPIESLVSNEPVIKMEPTEPVIKQRSKEDEIMEERVLMVPEKSDPKIHKDHVYFFSEESAITRGNRSQVNVADKSSHGQHIELQQAELQPWIESMSDYPKSNLHNSLRENESYQLLGDIYAMKAHNLLLPEVYKVFTRFLQRLNPKSYQQTPVIRAPGSIQPLDVHILPYVRQMWTKPRQHREELVIDSPDLLLLWLKPLPIDDVKTVSGVSPDPNTRISIQSKKRELWEWGGISRVKEMKMNGQVLMLMGAVYKRNGPSLKFDRKECNIMEQMLLRDQEWGIQLEIVEFLNSNIETQSDSSSLEPSSDMCVNEVLHEIFSVKFNQEIG